MAPAITGAIYDGAERLVSSLLEAVRQEFLRLQSRAGANPLVESVRSSIYRDLAKRVKLRQLAAGACMSTFHFIRTYRKAAGITPMGDVRRIRLEEAMKMVRTTGLPLRAIAASTGFANEYHFSQAFKKHFGSSPRAFRQ